MKDKYVPLLLFLAVCVICGTFGFVGWGRFQRDVQIKEIEQKEEAKRTEERSQFWQKAVPWGKDEE